MQSLGVTLFKLDAPGPIRGMAHAAKVVLPPSQEQVVSAPVDGVVDQLLVADQQAVRAGQPLLRISSPRFGELQLGLIEAANRSRLSAKTLERERQLLAEGIIPERRVLEAEAAAQTDQARLRHAEAALRLAGLDAAAIKGIAEAGALLDTLLIRARGDGVALGIAVKPGQRVQGADSLLRVANLRDLQLEIQMPADRQAPSPSPGSVVRAVDRDVEATTLSVGATVSESQTTTLRARVTRGAAALKPGEVIQVQVPFAQNSDGWALPLAAIARQDEQAYVFVRTGKGFVAQPVAIVSSAGQSVQVTGELKAGQEVAVSSVITLRAAWQGKGGSN
ncbi:MAG: efflux RND transporter periplasmic adaptor subunit [Steroidobacteraceae bacterium]|nr:efflux RND transporter periplasmic adaptor subunit [Steroidobacteraceae bacterium]